MFDRVLNALLASVAVIYMLLINMLYFLLIVFKVNYKDTSTNSPLVSFLLTLSIIMTTCSTLIIICLLETNYSPHSHKQFHKQILHENFFHKLWPNKMLWRLKVLNYCSETLNLRCLRQGSYLRLCEEDIYEDFEK